MLPYKLPENLVAGTGYKFCMYGWSDRLTNRFPAIDERETPMQSIGYVDCQKKVFFETKIT